MKNRCLESFDWKIKKIRVAVMCRQLALDKDMSI